MVARMRPGLSTHWNKLAHQGTDARTPALALLNDGHQVVLRNIAFDLERFQQALDNLKLVPGLWILALFQDFESIG